MKVIDREQRLTKVHLPKREGKIPLKRSTSGYEIENFILDSDGSIDHSDRLFREARARKIPVQKECAKAMIELVCIPSKKLSSVSINLAERLMSLNELAVKMGFHLYPFATYPGENEPQFRRKKWYSVQEKILGKENFRNAGLCCGYHQHYALPRGIFNRRAKFIRHSKTSKVKRTLLDSYNLLNAVDPILTLFLQSSPFVENRYLARDSRTVLYRSGRKLDHHTGVYANHQFFGGLSPYKQTLADLISSVRRRYKKWEQLLLKHGVRIEDVGEKGNVLKYAWNPVRINPIGTLEYRGGDMNFLSNLFGVATMMKFALRKIQQDFLIVIPTDMELRDAFRVENKVMFIPPHSLVRKNLQRESAYRGFRSRELLTYARAFYNFINKEVYKGYRPMLKPIKRMLDRKESVSDAIMKKARKKGYKRRIPQEFARELGIHYSERFSKDLARLHDLLQRIHSE